jgi:hypothetical protein
MRALPSCRLATLAAALLLVAACGSTSTDNEADGTSGSTASTGASSAAPPAPSSTTTGPEPSAPTAPSYILEMQQLTGENPFARIVYGCRTCDLEQFRAIPTPEGWVKGTPMIVVPQGDLVPPPRWKGIARSMDFVPGIAGNEFDLFARVRNGELVGLTADGPTAISQVERDTTFVYPAGTVVHEVTDPDGRRYVLFAVALRLVRAGIDLESTGAFSSVPLPDGWTYASRKLDDALTVRSGGLAHVFSQVERSLWQRYDPD